MNQSTEVSQPLEFVIIGGVAAGASAAARARRLDELAHITLIERGPDVSFANCGLPYHIGGEIAERDRLAIQTPESLKAMLNLDVYPLTEAVGIDRANKRIRVRPVDGGPEREIRYDKLLLAPGASALRPALPGIDDPRILTLRNMQDMDRIKAAVAGVREVAVIGAGFIGLEMAEQLVRLGKATRLVELQRQVLPQLDAEMSTPIANALMENGVDLILGDGIKAFHPGPENINIELTSGRRIEAEALILSIGVAPENKLAKHAGLDLGLRGHITVNEFMLTSDPDIYAAGDAVETRDAVTGQMSAVPLGGPANRQGRVVADHLFGRGGARPYPGSLGTAIVRAFDVTAGMTGWSEKRLAATGIAADSTIITDFHHAGYFPGARQLTIKIIWDRSDGRLLGAQVTGTAGVDKRLDVLATAIRARMKVEDLTDLELAYAPPFGSAKDPVNLAGMAASNIRAGLVQPVRELPDDPAIRILDVRPAAMAQLDPLPGAQAIPLAELRGRLAEIDKSSPVVTVCAHGKLSYFGARTLRQHGFDVRTLTGGLRARRSGLINHPPSNTNSPANISQSPPPPPPPPPMNLPEPAIRLDATGIACPGPIMKVKDACDKLAPGHILEVCASDAGFAKDFPAFCAATGREFLGVEKQGGVYRARLRQPVCASQPAPAAALTADKGTTIVVFSQEMDKAMASLVIANGALAMGGSATLFFTFWGLNVLRKSQAPPVAGKSFMAKMFAWMMPRGIDRLPLSNMHMAGMGTRMMKFRMASKKLPDLPGLLADARRQGVRLVACSMSMDAMGLRHEELIDGVEIGGVADFLNAANQTRANLFI